MKNLKSIIIIVIFVVIVGGIVYIVSPKRGYFGDLILSEYKGSNFNEIYVNSFSIGKTVDYKWEFECKDKDKINKFLSYLDKIKILEYRKYMPHAKDTKDSRMYEIHMSTEDYERLSLCIYDDNLQFMETINKYGVKRYKILSNKFDIKYIEGLK